MRKEMRSKNSTSSSFIPILILILVVLIIGTLIYIGWKIYKANNESVESYASPPNNLDLTKVSSSVQNFIREHGIDSVSALQGFIEGSYNEDISPIMEDNTLTLYYSAFSQKSLPVEQTRKLTNISPYFKDSKKPSCRFLQYESSHIDFIEPPYANRNMGIELLTNKAMGPPSHLLGIQGNGTFSMFMTLRFNGFSDNNEQEYELFKLYGNTEGNNALSLTIDAQPKSKDLASADVRILLHYGSQAPIPIRYENSEYFRIEFAKTYLFVITKLNKKISLNLHDLSKDLTYDSTHKLIENVELIDPNAFFSNKELSINGKQNLNANLFAFGLYNMYIMDEASLHHYIYKELFKSSETFQREARQILSFQKEIDELKACPYEENVCKECDDVTDWTDTNSIIKSSLKCRNAIDAFCTENTNHPKCSCWKASSMQTPECKSFVNVFKGLRMIDPENIDDATKEEISKRYKWCNCDEMDDLKAELNKLKEKLGNDFYVDEEDTRHTRLPPIDRLTSPFIKSGPVDYNGKNDDDTGVCNANDPTLLTNTPQDVLPDATHLRLHQLSKASTTYKGEENDDENFNKRVDTMSDQPTDPHEDINETQDYRYGESEIQPSKGFWAWLLNR